MRQNVKALRPEIRTAVALSAESTAVGKIVDASGQTFGESRLGSLCFYGNELVIADAAGLEFYWLEANSSPGLIPPG